MVRQRSRGALVSDPCGPPHLQSRAVAWRPCPAAGPCYGSWTGPPPAVCAGPELSRAQCGGPGSSPSWRERKMLYCNKRKTIRHLACWGDLSLSSYLSPLFWTCTRFWYNLFSALRASFSLLYSDTSCSSTHCRGQDRKDVINNLKQHTI